MDTWRSEPRLLPLKEHREAGDHRAGRWQGGGGQQVDDADHTSLAKGPCPRQVCYPLQPKEQSSAGGRAGGRGQLCLQHSSSPCSFYQRTEHVGIGRQRTAMWVYLPQRRPQHPPNPFPENRTHVNSTLSCILGRKLPGANLKLKLVAWRILTGPL